MASNRSKLDSMSARTTPQPSPAGTCCSHQAEIFLADRCPLNAAAMRHILQGALSDAVADQDLYMQGIDASFACRDAAADPCGTAGPPATGGAARQRACPLCGTLCSGRGAVCPDCGRSAV